MVLQRFCYHDTFVSLWWGHTLQPVSLYKSKAAMKILMFWCLLLKYHNFLGFNQIFFFSEQKIYITSTSDGTKWIIFCLNLSSACAYVDWIKAGICMPSYCCAAVALFTMRKIILKTLVLSQVHENSVTGNGHYSPSTIKSSQLAPLSWFIFFTKLSRVIMFVWIAFFKVLVFHFKWYIWWNCN